MTLLSSLVAAWVADTRKNRPALNVFLIALAWLSCLAWMRPLALPDEGRYVGVAWEMLASRDFVTPTLDGMPFLHKPPLFYWLTALFLHIVGPHEIAARGASILAASAAVVAVYLTVSRWLGERCARIAALVLATQPLFFAAAQYANMDMLVAACISIAILLGAAAAIRFEAAVANRRELAGMYVALALGVLTKGLIGLVIPATVLFLWLGFVGQWRTLRSLFWLPGVMTAAVIVVPWFAATQWTHAEFFDYFFVVQQFRRFVGSGYNNVQPIWFYVPVLLVLTVPWSGWLLTAVRPPREARGAKPAVVSLMWIWVGTVFVFFSIPQSKLIGYILPALVPMAILVAHAVTPRFSRSGSALKWFRLSLGAAASVCIGAAVGFALAHPKSSRALAAAMAGEFAPGDGVLFVDDYSYDLAFYLRATVPAFVNTDWNPAEIQRHDNWRKELADAGAFAPTRARERLLDETQMLQAVCDGRIRWVIVKVDRSRSYPFLAQTLPFARDGEKAVWKLDKFDLALRKLAGCEAGGVKRSP